MFIFSLPAVDLMSIFITWRGAVHRNLPHLYCNCVVAELWWMDGGRVSVFRVFMLSGPWLKTSDASSFTISPVTTSNSHWWLWCDWSQSPVLLSLETSVTTMTVVIDITAVTDEGYWFNWSQWILQLRVMQQVKAEPCRWNFNNQTPATLWPCRNRSSTVQHVFTNTNRDQNRCEHSHGSAARTLFHQLMFQVTVYRNPLTEQEHLHQNNSYNKPYTAQSTGCDSYLCDDTV